MGVDQCSAGGKTLANEMQRYLAAPRSFAFVGFEKRLSVLASYRVTMYNECNSITFLNLLQKAFSINLEHKFR